MRTRRVEITVTVDQRGDHFTASAGVRVDGLRVGVLWPSSTEPCATPNEAAVVVQATLDVSGTSIRVGSRVRAALWGAGDG